MKKLLSISKIFIFLGLIILFALNGFIIFSTKNQIVENNFAELNNFDCIIVLGAGIWGDEPSPMLKDRLQKAITLYQEKVAPKIIMSGDHTRANYDEVNIMKKYAVNEGVPSSDIFMDHAGISTYDSIYRAKKIFGVNKAIIVSQEYHLYRALYIANSLGLEAIGIPAEKIKYSGSFKRELREILARDKDFVKSIFKPPSKYLGNSINVFGSGDITNDK